MRDESARARIDVARARVPSLLAVAQLTLGDPGRARSVTTAAVADALGHPAPEDSQPAQHLRDALVVALFREIAPARGSTRRRPPGAWPDRATTRPGPTSTQTPTRTPEQSPRRRARRQSSGTCATAPRWSA
jgi:hypothetical protein